MTGLKTVFQDSIEQKQLIFVSRTQYQIPILTELYLLNVLAELFVKWIDNFCCLSLINLLMVMK